MSIDKQLEDMKKLAIMTGSLTDPHLLNLRNWIYILFAEPNHEILDINYSIDGDDSHRNSGNFIKYTLRVDKRKKQMSEEAIEKAIEALSRWVGTLLWKNIAIKVLINDKEYLGES